MKKWEKREKKGKKGKKEKKREKKKGKKGKKVKRGKKGKKRKKKEKKGKEEKRVEKSGKEGKRGEKRGKEGKRGEKRGKKGKRGEKRRRVEKSRKERKRGEKRGKEWKRGEKSGKEGKRWEKMGKGRKRGKGEKGKRRKGERGRKGKEGRRRTRRQKQVPSTIARTGPFCSSRAWKPLTPMDSNTVTESDLSLKSWSFLHRVNDRVRKMLHQSSKDATQDSDKHSLIRWMIMSSTLEASIFMGKEYSEILRSAQSHNETDVWHIWEVESENQMRFMEWLQLAGKILHVNNYLWSVMKKSSVSRMPRFTYFQILCYALERWARTHNQILSGKTSWRGSRVHHNTELWTQSMVSQWNSSGIFPRIHHIAALQQSPRVHEKMSDQPE